MPIELTQPLVVCIVAVLSLSLYLSPSLFVRRALLSNDASLLLLLAQVLPHVQNDAWRLTFVNNANACFIFLPFVLWFEGATLVEVRRESNA